MDRKNRRAVLASRQAAPYRPRVPLLPEAIGAVTLVLLGFMVPPLSDRIRYGRQQRPGRLSREAWQFRKVVGAAGIDIPRHTGGGWAKEAGDAVIERVERVERARVLLEIAQMARDPEVDADTLRDLKALFLPANVKGRPSGG